MLQPILGWLGLAPDRKAAQTRPPPLGSTLAFYLTGRPVWTARDYTALAREGFQRNAVVHRAVRLVAEAAASIPLTLTEDGRAVDRHPVLDILAAPNRREAGTRFLEGIYGHLMVSGNAYLQAASVDGVPRELYGLRPDRMRVVPGTDGWPEAYDYAVGSRTLRFEQEGEGVPPILHLTLFHPLDDHYGSSPMEAAAVALDIHNAAGAWNKALLDNAARPSGALVFAGPSGASLTDIQFDRLKTELAQNYQGAGNAGRPLLLDGGLDWKPLSLSPKDMDFVEAKNGAAREIALAFGVPPLLLGLNGDNTHANYAEANRAFYRQTAIPLARRTGEALIQWLGPAFGPASRAHGFRLEPDLDAIEALATERESLWRRVGGATFLDEDERREAVGYGRRVAGARAPASTGKATA
ncbi:phage portal protein [uncultured Enterovirga sp.]|uniref:phage portal protein n=1 Tax=uncultured Enterovirga sp. TaxID=2026352 RepID=UPI0035C96DEE